MYYLFAKMIQRYSCLNFIDCRYPSAGKFTVKIKYVFPIRNQSCHNIAGKALFPFLLYTWIIKYFFYFYRQVSQQPQVKRIWNIFVIAILDISIFWKIVLLVDIKISLSQRFCITQINVFQYSFATETFLIENKKTFPTTLFFQRSVKEVFLNLLLLYSFGN